MIQELGGARLVAVRGSRRRSSLWHLQGRRSGTVQWIVKHYSAVRPAGMSEEGKELKGSTEKEEL